eukprot:CAMPEP_0206473082 /NCGR_PEP_ID=MMETSP0324_2-20121206/32624_1 /ASSEMBLY_ACC=CAM_ASM_000836 /TAXON_ID=2866 /ORGANISM="Crypthecodinium cohnii, Strain Seligo" /LENGTH=268 /DNA_ID=CAMNT_0053947885 /DNA_START=168 /DNA_END=974 /DNA_ORIENTATION=+
MALKLLKQRLEGVRKKVSNKPEIYIVVEELFLPPHNGSVLVGTDELLLEQLKVKAVVEIIGPRHQILAELGREAARRTLKKGIAKLKLPIKAKGWRFTRGATTSATVTNNIEEVHILGKSAETLPAMSSEEHLQVGVADPSGDSTSAGTSRSLSPSQDREVIMQTCYVELSINAKQLPGEEKVKVKIKDLDVGENTFASSQGARKVLRSPKVVSLLEAAIASHLQKTLTKQVRKSRAKLLALPCFRYCRCLWPLLGFISRVDLRSPFQ